MSKKIENAINVLRKEFDVDKGYYMAWQANIAMAFYDEYYKSTSKYKNKGEIHKIANEAAKNFISSLLRKEWNEI